ncbi:MAG: glycosyltransferase, partial [Parvularcula sp.]|nr:glycosyltransferase [Parvularcula sp.]
MHEAVTLVIPTLNIDPESIDRFRAFASQFEDRLVLSYDGGALSPDESRRLQSLDVVTGGPRSGPGAARNRGAASVSDSWIHFHDADDEMDDDLVVSVLPHLTEDFDVVLVDSDWIAEDSREVVIARRYRQDRFARDPIRETLVNPVGVLSAFIRTSLFAKINGFCENRTCWEDGDLFVRLAAAGARFSCTEQVKVRSIRHGRGISSDQKNCGYCRLSFLEEYAESLPPSYYPTLGGLLEPLLSAFLAWKEPDYVERALTLGRRLNYPL